MTVTEPNDPHTSTSLVSGDHRPLGKPRRQLGPDAILMLRNVSLQHTGDKYAYDAYRVQRNKSGGPAPEFDFKSLEFVGVDHPDSYGVMINRRIIPEAKKWAGRMLGRDPSMIHHNLSYMLRQAASHDSTFWWICSSALVRSILFPKGYNEEGRRADRIVYRDQPKDWTNRGNAVQLSKLTEAGNYRFVEYAMHMTNNNVCPATITPFKKERSFS